MKKISKGGKAVTLIGVMLGATSLSYAQAPQDLERPGLYASVQVAVIDDDNILRQPDVKTSDAITVIAPDVAYVMFMGKHRLIAQYLGEYGTFADYGDEDYTDHTFNAELFLDLTPKFNMDLQVGQILGHESRGSSGVVTGVSTKPNEWEDTGAFAQLTYGRRIATAQFQLEADTRELRFTNNSQEFRDRDINAVTGRFFYNMGPKTSVFLEATQRDIDYVTESSTLDSTEQFLHLGVRWEATAKTTGELKVGTFDKDFDSTSRKDDDGTSLVANITWEPRTYSRVVLTALSQPDETSTGDSFYLRSYYALDWKHAFNDKLNLNVNLGSGTDDYSGTRKDELVNYGLGLTYGFRRWFDVSLNYKYTERDSNIAEADYESNVYMLTAMVKIPE